MDVSGRKRSLDAILFCQPCKGDDDTVQAEGYCEDCNEFICSSCIKAHRKLAVTKFHVIKFKGEMPSFLTARNDACTELCDYHKNEIVKFYCNEHNSVGCRDCMVLKHTSCKIQLVSDVSRKCNVSDELVYTKYRIDHLKKSLASCKEEIKCSLQTADEIKAIAIKDIKQFCKDMDTYLDNVEETLMQEVEMVNDCDVRTQKKLHDQCDEINDEIVILQSKLEQCKDNINNLFVTSKLVQEKLQKCHEINKDISSKSQIHTFKFTPSEEMNALKIDNKSIGHLDKQLKKYPGKCRECIIGIKAHLSQKFDIKTKQEWTVT
ncbi:transcription intermediary factor 1-beta-like [Ruditapes philippinarum]|uniref:transcription intermediary factor 1-beta-like n=1 Tax=Ruditapes philippinarum TaxID=129788 RepID=UPI00295ABE27|nr:transcription intermediary factor 1-beta-like [Ruditapes philippinarum]